MPNKHASRGQAALVFVAVEVLPTHNMYFSIIVPDEIDHGNVNEISHHDLCPKSRTKGVKGCHRSKDVRFVSYATDASCDVDWNHDSHPNDSKHAEDVPQHLCEPEEYRSVHAQLLNQQLFLGLPYWLDPAKQALSWWRQCLGRLGIFRARGVDEVVPGSEEGKEECESC